jgi:hypothetical protein
MPRSRTPLLAAKASRQSYYRTSTAWTDSQGGYSISLNATTAIGTRVAMSVSAQSQPQIGGAPAYVALCNSLAAASRTQTLTFTYPPFFAAHEN